MRILLSFLSVKIYMHGHKQNLLPKPLCTYIKFNGLIMTCIYVYHILNVTYLQLVLYDH